MNVQSNEQEKNREFLMTFRALLNDEAKLRKQFELGTDCLFVPRQLKAILARLEANLDIVNKCLLHG